MKKDYLLRNVEIRNSYDSSESDEDNAKDTTAVTKLIQDKRSSNR